MKNIATAAVTIPILLMSLAACGAGNTAAPANSAPAATQTVSPSASAAQTPSASPSASAAASPSASPDPSPSPDPTEAPVELTYRMNKNYDIVPIDKETTNSKVVLLTFDDGPKAEETLKPILDTLDKHHAKAIFFVNGYRVKAHPELLQEIDERGHTVGNHSWDHIMLGKEKPETIREQIEKVQNIVEEVIGKKPVFFRPPNASGNEYTHSIAKENGLLYMTWSDGSLDWEMTGDKIKDKTAAIIKNVNDLLHPGSNILMHELPWTGEALDALLTDLEQKGYSFVDPEAIDTEA
ncbi:polysaccharide deacetylase family protein [Cohnella lubricantis]|uniref:Polysaccharide deacetylase family protein n=1 Tax=Cohnella lubricantis TaxID=2163172 RepID=A0A841TC60_9BACL|nr:polysaccharide deacetylase family protein [Cohnella lubricantis]MBB6677716.1 polysaccharide deacetylase family protein [Cohnella lubricantis]MBP2117678.1 peptidoglycan/xylan/chitin deacetylase (PgdA/CDA1 family) [Cohnella lubricantis]